ncbi:MAG: ABC transporter ATP-binding protein [Actinobacteria bacterium]|nr:ABC transporter ATP-binding protein [Actinomycetota bacterium]
MTEVKLTGIVKSFPGRPPTVALRGVDLTIPSTSIVAVLGPSGCGKTTMLRLIAGFDRPDAGTISIGDTVVSGPGVHLAPDKRRVGIVPQEGALFPHLDVGGNVAFGLRSLDRSARARRVAEMLELVGLGGYERRRADELSGGQQQRVALARALAVDPDVVLLDEPFTALDSTLRGAVRDEVAALLNDAGATALLVTHDQDEAFAMADSIAVMRAGTIVQHASPETLYRHPRDLQTAHFVGDAVELMGERRGSTVSCTLGELAVSATGGDGATGEVVAMLRPEQIVPAHGAGIAAVIEGEVYHGHDVLVMLRIGDERVDARWPGTARFELGARIEVTVEGEALVFARPDAPAPTP